MDLSCTISEIDGRFQSKIAIFSTPVYFAPPLKGFPWELGIGTQVKKLESWNYRAEKKV